MRARTLLLTLTLTLGLVAGCADNPAARNVVIAVDVAKAAARPADLERRAEVLVTDIRTAAASERRSFGVSLGLIDFSPPPVAIVRALVETRADEVLAKRAGAGRPTILAGLRAFDVATPNTALYWDVGARIEIVLRMRGRDVDRVATGSATERTYVYPSEAIIGRVVAAALAQAASETGIALEALVAAAQ